MPIRAEFEELNALIADAAASCERAQQRFVQVHDALRKAIDEGRLTARAVLREEKARQQLVDARVRLAELRHQRPQ